jgi:N-acetyl sugar amidotransferase
MTTVVSTSERPKLRLARTPATGRQICTRCIMDTSDPEIRFDQNGVCNHCHKFDYRVKTELYTGDDAEHAIGQIVARIKHDGRRKEYDCIIGVSGGVDSTYVAYLVKRHGLRPLAVHLDNGWNSELAVANIEKTLKTLGIDLYTHVVDWEEFRDLHRAFLKASVANSEIPTDHAIIALLYQQAAARGIRYIISGGNVTCEGVMPSSWMYDCKDLRHLKDVHRRFGDRPLETLPTFSLVQFAYWVLIKQIRNVRILNYVPYRKKDTIALLQRELGWRDYGGKHFESLYTKWFQAYMLPTKFKIDKRLAHFSALILSGQMTREDALKQIAAPTYDPQQLAEDTEFLLKKLGFTPAEFQQIMDTPPRTVHDFKSNVRILQGMPTVMRLAKCIATGDIRKAA